MVAQMNLMPFQPSEGASINLLMQPLQQGLQSYRQGMDKQFEGERALKKEQLAERADTRQQQAFDLEQQKAKVQSIAGIAQMADQEKDPTRRAAIINSLYQQHPDIVPHLKNYVDPGDHVNVPKFLIAEARGFVDPLQEQAKRMAIANAGLDYQIKKRDLETPAAKLTVVPEGGVLVGTDPRTGQHQEIARGNDKTKIPPGYRPTADNNLEAIPGGPADIKQNEKRQQDYASATQVIQQLDELNKSVNDVLSAPGLPKNFGLQGYVPNMPGGKAADAAALLETLRARGGFAVLQEMRNASKTGGALGNVSDAEGKRLEASLAALAKASSYDQVVTQLKNIIAHNEASKQRIRDAYNDHWNRNGEAAKREMGAPTGPARIRDDSDYNRLPSGSRFIDPEGNVRIKP